MEPKFVDLGAFTVMGVLVHAMPDRVDFGAFWENEFMPHHEAIRALSTDGAYYGVWLPHHGDGIPDYVAGMAVPDDAPVREGVIVRQVPASRYAAFECTIQTVGATYDYVYQTWLGSSPYDRLSGGADLEYYPPEGATDASPALYIPIRDKQEGAGG